MLRPSRFRAVPFRAARLRAALALAPVALAPVALAFALAAPTVQAQAVGSPLLYLQRGQLWNSYYYAKTGAPFNNWRRVDVGMDWPGYEFQRLQTDVGGPASHLLTGGIWFSSKDSRGRVVAIDDFAMYATSTTPELDAKYRVVEHRKVYGESGNHFLATNPGDAEDVIRSVWERNPSWTAQFAGDRQHPIRVRREVRQWGGYEREQNYILVEYTIKNLADSTLRDAVAMGAWAFGMNDRSHRILFPQLSSGARNTRFFFNPVQRLLAGWAVDNPDTPENETHGWRAGFGPAGDRGGEFLAPAYVGIQVLNVSRNKAGQTNQIVNHAWMPADPNQDQQGPMVGQSGFDNQYAVLRDPRTARSATNNPSSTIFGRYRIWSMMSMGPWDFAPGDSITIAYAEAIGGASYTESTGLTIENASTISQRGLAALTASGQRAQFAYANRNNVPDPPPAPPFSVALYANPADPSQIGNVVTWKNTHDAARDPDYTGAEAVDLAGYRLYRSSYLPIGPWALVREIPKGTPTFLSGDTYTFVDTTARIGNAYYYALTAFDTGHATWPVSLAARFAETGNTNRVPVLESSLFANRSRDPFATTIPKADDLSGVLVVPNPFVQGSGTSTPGLEDQIQFVNVPSPAVIRIYTMRGTLVATIRHTEESGIARWNQQTDGELFVESGIYLYTVEAPGIGTTTGKLAIVR